MAALGLLFFGGLTWCEVVKPDWLLHPSEDWHYAVTRLRQLRWFNLLMMCMSLLALVRGEVPRWLSAQFSASEYERRRKMDDIGSNPWA